MRVLSIVLNNFKNDSRVLKECISLKKAGYEISVCALHEGDLPEEEIIEGIPVRRIKLSTRKYSKSLPMQMVKYMELRSKIVKLYRNKVDIIHCNDILPLPIAVSLKRKSKRDVKIVYDAHEFQTETQKLQGKQTRKTLIYLLEKNLIKKVDKVITVSDGIAEEYAKRYHIPKPALVLNCPYYDDPRKENRFREKFDIKEDQKILLYQGALTEGRGLKKLMEAFRRLNRTDLALVFMGYGALQKDIELAANETKNIYFHPAVAPNEILSYTVSADVGICLIENSCLNYYYCLPNKLFEYAMAGLPVVASNLPEIKRIVETYQCGVISESLTVEGFSQTIQRLLDTDMVAYSVNAKKMAKTYNWETQEKVLLDVYRDLESNQSEVAVQ
ncbi:glycosyltransferase family 4 protein [Tuberibacillus calidus]|jgi:glycosyltransferase involved in cell wall biosynthesis|uniref:glycosyltransferase family 4 protein n=1 Tax=Tuberibacillus calidus TaxID=340097 RepID=UPI00048219BD|nr:glycosyltransferase family 4 protein [Tuberibacillus calidus]